MSDASQVYNAMYLEIHKLVYNHRSCTRKQIERAVHKYLITYVSCTHTLNFTSSDIASYYTTPESLFVILDLLNSNISGLYWSLVAAFELNIKVLTIKNILRNNLTLKKVPAWKFNLPEMLRVNNIPTLNNDQLRKFRSDLDVYVNALMDNI
jgi:hypothetical protein